MWLLLLVSTLTLYTIYTGGLSTGNISTSAVCSLGSIVTTASFRLDHSWQSAHCLRVGVSRQGLHACAFKNKFVQRGCR